MQMLIRCTETSLLLLPLWDEKPASLAVKTPEPIGHDTGKAQGLHFNRVVRVNATTDGGFHCTEDCLLGHEGYFLSNRLMTLLAILRQLLLFAIVYYYQLLQHPPSGQSY